LLLTRQNVPVLPGTKEGGLDQLARGGYILADAPGGAPEVLLVAAGSEVAVALAAQERLAAQGVAARVVSMPSWELFAAQDAGYRAQVLPPQLTARVAVEAGVALGWQRFADTSVSIDRFGESGKGPAVMAHLGITPEHVAQQALAVLGR
jgi:transketolase